MQTKSNKHIAYTMISGLIGCVLMAASDWIMIYGDTTYEGSIAWLTLGVTNISATQNALAMVLAFGSIIFYSIALFSVSSFIKDNKHKHIYSYLTAIGLTPWLCLHLLYVMILFTFAHLYSSNETLAYSTCEAMFSQFSFIVIIGEILILLPFIYLFYLFASKKTIFKKAMAINNPLLIYVLLKLLTYAIPDCPFRLAFTNGLMSESMLIWFVVLLISSIKINNKAK